MPFNPKFSITPKINKALVEIERRTATRDLTGLVEKGILEKRGEKKGTYYIISPKIAEKIRGIKRHT